MPASPPSPTTAALQLLPASGKVELCFVLLHGAGANALQMQPLAQALRAQYPQAAVLSIDAPQALDTQGDGAKRYQWFEAAEPEGLSQALPDLVAQLRAWITHFQLDWPQLALGGFGQGAQLALEAVQAEARLAGRVLAFAGCHARPPEQAPDQVSLHFLQGMDDAVQPYRAVVATAQALVSLGADVTADIRPGIGHELHPQLIDKALEQLRSFIPARLWREAMLAAAEQERTAGKT